MAELRTDHPANIQAGVATHAGRDYTTMTQLKLASSNDKPAHPRSGGTIDPAGLNIAERVTNAPKEEITYDHPKSQILPASVRTQDKP